MYTSERTIIIQQNKNFLIKENKHQCSLQTQTQITFSGFGFVYFFQFNKISFCKKA